MDTISLYAFHRGVYGDAGMVCIMGRSDAHEVWLFE